MNHTIGIVAHQKRIEDAHWLAEQVNATYISIDDPAKRLGCDKNHHRVWQTLAKNDTEWTVVLEDDAQPVPDFPNQLTAALHAAPEPVVSLYLGRRMPTAWQTPMQTATQQATHAGAHWITTNRAIHAVGLAIHTALIPELLTHWRAHLPADEAISSWIRRTDRTCAYTWPSLVNHKDLPTLIHQHRDGIPRTPGRTAWRTGGHNTWNSHTVWMDNPMNSKRPQRSA